MKELHLTELTLENFRPFGSFSQMIDPQAQGAGIPWMTFYADLAVLELGGAHMAAFSTTRVLGGREPVIVCLENHSHTGEGILALDGDMLVYFAPACLPYEKALDQLAAFRVPKGMLLTIRPGVWHCMPFPVRGQAAVNVLNVLPERTYANDCASHILAEDQRIRIAE